MFKGREREGGRERVKRARKETEHTEVEGGREENRIGWKIHKGENINKSLLVLL